MAERDGEMYEEDSLAAFHQSTSILSPKLLWENCVIYRDIPTKFGDIIYDDPDELSWSAVAKLASNV